VGTSGREIPVIGRATCQLENGWPQHTDVLTFEAGRRVVVTAREGAVASGGVLPIAFKEFAGEGRLVAGLGRALLGVGVRQTG